MKDLQKALENLNAFHNVYSIERYMNGALVLKASDMKVRNGIVTYSHNVKDILKVIYRITDEYLLGLDVHR